jgi:hypothetical protein
VSGIDFAVWIGWPEADTPVPASDSPGAVQRQGSAERWRFLVSIATWDGPKLTIVTKQEMGGQVTESTQVWTVDGSTLTVETTNARGTQKRVYKK